MHLRRVQVVGHTFAAALAHLSNVFTPLRLRHEISAWAFGCPAGDRRLAGEEQLGRCAAGQGKCNRLYLNSGK
jgi:hypothetical protein